LNLVTSYANHCTSRSPGVGLSDSDCRRQETQICGDCRSLSESVGVCRLFDSARDCSTRSRLSRLGNEACE
jgi:hypothetical protein